MEERKHNEGTPESAIRQLPLALIRIVIGWHFLYEGFAKLLTPGWTAGGYLKSATGPVAGLFHWMGSGAAAVKVIDQLNIWGLVLIGLGLMAGVLARPAAAAGIALLGFYYLAYPPLFERVSAAVTEGQYLIVNKSLIEMLALWVVFAYPAPRFSAGPLLARLWNRSARVPLAGSSPEAPRAIAGPYSRRELVYGLAGLPVLGGFVLAVLKKHGWKSFEETHLRVPRQKGDITIASASTRRFEYLTLRDLKGQLPTARIRNLALSRVILGGNLIAGYAHARDLIYVSKLVQAYHTRSKIFQTLDLAESCGINALLTNPVLCDVIQAYWRTGGTIKFISDCGFGDILEMVKKSVDRGAASCYIQGGTADDMVAKGKFDRIAAAVELIRKNGLPAGIGAHKLETVQKCVENGIHPDYWMKTLHQTYWSATVQPQRDNCWCDDPDATIAYMEGLPEPWIAFKVLGAGALKPAKAFEYAFRSGADFLCVGMYDFQIVEDVNIALAVLNKKLDRQRPWRA